MLFYKIIMWDVETIIIINCEYNNNNTGIINVKQFKRF